MDRFPRGSLPPSAFTAIATVAPVAVARVAADGSNASAGEAGGREPATEASPACDLTTTCPTCLVEMRPEHAHYKCLRCGYRDSCCF